LLVLLVDDVDGHGYFRPFFFTGSTCATFTALGVTALRITTTLLGPPGTAPSRSSRLLSASTFSTFRLRTVTRSAPMWPAIRMPFTTRDGYDEAPIEPGARWNIEPCVARPPAKWCRLTT